MSEPKSFFDLYLRGRVSEEKIDDFIDDWHDTMENLPEAEVTPLHTFLGMSKNEYGTWFQHPDRLPKLAERPKHYLQIFDKPIQENNLRKCQKLAYNAIREHFLEQATPKRQVLVQLPTGTGKSVLVAIAPFGISRGKVLVITPNLKLVTQIKNDLDLQLPSNAYKTLNLFAPGDLADEASKLFCLVLDNTTNQGDVVDNVVVLANFHQLYDLDKWFAESKEEVSVVIIDEAHHQEAATYQAVLDYFPDAKIIGLTGTPFRTDGKRVEGERIYKYSYEDAINDGIIRNFSHHDVTSKEVELVFKDQQGSKQYTLEEILRLSETAWFQRKVALSQDCCDSIAAKAKEKLEKLRAAFPNENHQIIAAAMTIRHAREEVKNAFEKLNLRVGLVSSDKEDLPKNEAVFTKLKQNQLDVIINVGMLGEGFDHKPLGVAAIFRPYKSLNPYIQFIGRIIRKNGSTDRAYIVSHTGLNQVARFKEFKLFDKDEQAFLQRHLFTDAAESSQDEMFVAKPKETKENSSSDETANWDDSQIVELGTQLIETQHDFVDKAKVGFLIDRIKDLNPEEKQLLVSLLAKAAPDLVQTFKKTPPPPTDKRKAARKHLFERGKSLTMDIAKALGIRQPMKTRTFNPLFNDYQWIIKRVTKKITEYSQSSGVPEDRAGKRRELRNEDYQVIDDNAILEKVKQESIGHFTKALAKKQSLKKPSKKPSK